jgi:hypothetical protein
MEGEAMNLHYAVDRLVQTGWRGEAGMELETLPDGRAFPGVRAVQSEFARAGLELIIKHNPSFHCCRASWAPCGEPIDPVHEQDESHGTVIGACEREAAVYALAQLRSAQIQRPLQTA